MFAMAGTIAAAVLGSMFAGVLIGSISGKMTIGTLFGMFSAYLANVAHSQLLSMGASSSQAVQGAVGWAVIGQIVLWLAVWAGSWVKMLR